MIVELHNHLLPGTYFVMAPIPELGAIPGDFVCIDPKDENPFVLTRILDRFDGETMLATLGAVRPIPPSSSASSRRRGSSWRRAQHSQHET